MNRPPEIRTARSADVDNVAALIGHAFATLDVTAWLVPDPDQRAAVLTSDFRIVVEHALTHGQIHIIDDHDDKLAAAAVWIHHQSETAPAPPPPDYDRRLDAACGSHADRFRILDGLFADHHPHVYPHHHLAMIATRPDRQNHGLGTTLLAQHHAFLDQKHIDAYLEASSEQSRRLYERHGYHRLGEAFHVPSGAPMWPMWRETDR
ncbi:MAG: GNAT family N-acetyltransferase [Actinophytocola sp.]|uniref:GNAT family N-acetyltransferase n=1 Tax=Actinophytocola sp. TaxID=1872138 RepID=UPI003C77982C